VHVYEHNSRGPVKPDQNKAIPMSCPCHFVHCDQSYNGAKTIALSRIPDKAFAEKAVQGHFGVINVSIVPEWLSHLSHQRADQDILKRSGVLYGQYTKTHLPVPKVSPL
jgi:hypothetical protein